MNIRPKIPLLVSAAACVMFCAGLCLADDASIPSNWTLSATTPSEPVTDVYFGKMSLLKFADPKKHDAGRATFDVWGKYVYKKPQVRDGKTFTTDIVEFALDCNASTVAMKREILQDADGKTVFDDPRAQAPTKVNFPAIRDLDDYSEAVNIAYISMDFTCNADGD